MFAYVRADVCCIFYVFDAKQAWVFAFLALPGRLVPAGNLILLACLCVLHFIGDADGEALRLKAESGLRLLCVAFVLFLLCVVFSDTYRGLPQSKVA